MASLRPLTPDDQDRVLAINDEWVHVLAPLDADGYRWFLTHAHQALAIEVRPDDDGDQDPTLAGFVLVLAPGLAYPSANYAWFEDRLDGFAYLDRIAITGRHGRSGLGTLAYDAVEARAAALAVPVALEVNEDPPNEASLAFHARRGFERIGSLTHPDGKVTAMLVKAPST